MSATSGNGKGPVDPTSATLASGPVSIASSETIAPGAAIAATMASDAGVAATMASDAGVAATLPSGPRATQDSGTAATIVSMSARPGGGNAGLVLEVVERARYEHGRELARGGMGRIRIARDRRLDREVAIKELLVDNAESRARFEREVRITAKLQHPAIVNILEAGAWPGGEPFYVMKLVVGESFDRVIRKHGSFAERVGLLPHVIDVVEALAFAHSRGVIHRDLKPANVLVGDFGETVVIDWGLAREVGDRDSRDGGAGAVPPSDDGATVAGSVLGTPAYMAPEQARGDALDERADVYALGAMLYHVLAGRAPADGKSVPELLAKVAAGKRAPLSEVAPEVPHDLAAIVEKAMAFDASERYPTAAELAQDLQRYQAGQLVGATRYSTWQLVRRWIGRHRAAVTVGAIAFATVAVLAVVSLRRIFAEQAATEAQRTVAEAHRVDAEDLLGYLLADVSPRLASIGNVKLREDVAKTVMRYYETHPPRTPLDKQKRIGALVTVGAALHDQRDLVGAVAQLGAAIALAEELARADASSVPVREQLARARTKLADTLVLQGNLDAALAERRAVLAIQEALAASDRSAVRQREVAIARTGIGIVHYERGELAPALAEGIAARDALAPLVQADRTPPALLAQWSAHHLIADVHVKRVEYERALVELRAAAALADEVAAREPTNVEAIDHRATSYERIAEVSGLLGRSDALDGHVKAVEIATALALRDPSNTRWQRNLAASHAKLAARYLPARDYKNALAHYREGHAILSRLVTLDVTDTTLRVDLSVTDMEIAAIMFAQDDIAAAERHTRAAIAALERAIENAPQQANALRLLAKAHDDLGSILVERNDAAGAEKAIEQGLARAMRLFELDRSNVLAIETLAVSRESLADLRVAAKHPDAIAALRAMREVHDLLLAKDPKSEEYRGIVARGRTKLGMALATTNTAEAAVELRAALAHLEARAAAGDARAAEEKTAVLAVLAACCSK